MADVRMAYGTPTSMTITLTSLANSSLAGRESNSVDNSVNLYLDALVHIKTACVTGTASADKSIYIYGYGTLDEGTPLYPDRVTGADAAVTMKNPPNLPLIGTLSIDSVSTTASGINVFKGGPFSVAAAFGGMMPRRWGIVVQNMSGVALEGTATYHDVKYQGLHLAAT